MNDNLEVARAAVAITLELEGRRGATESHLDRVLIALDEHPEGEAAKREAIVNFAAVTELYLNSISDEEREILFDSMAWDWVWLPGIMSLVQAEGVDWFTANINQVAEASDVILKEVQENGE